MMIRFGILTLSDRSARGEREDASGPALARLLEAEGWSVTADRHSNEQVLAFDAVRWAPPDVPIVVPQIILTRRRKPFVSGLPLLFGHDAQPGHGDSDSLRLEPLDITSTSNCKGHSIGPRVEQSLSYYPR